MATVVTLVALVGLIAAVTMGSEMLDVSRKQTVATQILRNEIEQVRLRSWSSFPILLPTNYTITINAAGTGLSAGGLGDQQAFALTNYTYSYAPPYSSGTFDDNTDLMSLAKDFTCSVTITSVRANLLCFTYRVVWRAGNQHKTYMRMSSTYYGKTGLNLYYQK